jgi:hypothetical protein
MVTFAGRVPANDDRRAGRHRDDIRMVSDLRREELRVLAGREPDDLQSARLRVDH